MNVNLVIYDSTYGHTKKILDELFSEEKGIQIVHVSEVGHDLLDNSKRIALGGSIQKGKIQESISSFCRNNSTLLKQKPLSLFITCLEQERAAEQLADAFPPSLYEHSSLNVCLGGELDLSRLNVFTRYSMRLAYRKESDRMWRDSLGIIRFREFLHGD